MRTEATNNEAGQVVVEADAAYIEWQADDTPPFPLYRGKVLRRGYPHLLEDGSPGVRFILKWRGDNAFDVALADRPGLAALHANCLAIQAEQQAAADAAAEKAIIAPVAECPANFIPLHFSHSIADGAVAIYRDAEGREFDGVPDAVPSSTDRNTIFVPADWHQQEVLRREGAVADQATAQIEAKHAADEHLAECRAEATRTGKRIAIRRWHTDRCMNGNADECSQDLAIEWACPDGETRTTCTCTC